MTATPLWDDCLAQGANLAHVVAHLYGPERARLEAAGRFLSGRRPLVFTGVASAAYLCMPAQTYTGGLGRFASVVYAPDALYHVLPMLRRAGVIVSSRSGETVEIVRLAAALARGGHPVRGADQ